MNKKLSLYKDNLNTMTPLELTLRCHSRAIEYIEEAELCLANNDKVNFVANVHKALQILESFMFSLQIILDDGTINESSHQSFMVYEFITRILRKGMIDFSIYQYDICRKYLKELHDAYKTSKYT